MHFGRSLFRDIVVWYTLCVTAVVVIYAWQLYDEIERGRRKPFDVQLVAQAQRVAGWLRMDNEQIDLTAFPPSELRARAFAVYDEQWRTLLVSMPWHELSWAPLEFPRGEYAERYARGETWFGITADSKGRRHRVAVVRLPVLPLERTLGGKGDAQSSYVYMVYSAPYETVQAYLGVRTRKLLITLGLLWLAIVLSGVLVARTGVRPLRRLAVAARAISADDPRTRLPVERLPDELQDLAMQLNEAFDRLEAAIATERNFTAAAAHELRSPVAGIAARLDDLQRLEDLPEDLRTRVESVYADADKLRRLSGQLMLLSRLDRAAAGEAFPRAEVDLADVAADAADFCRGTAAEREIAIEVDARGDAHVHGHEEWLLRAVYNLVTNAVKFTADGTRVQLRIESTADDQRVMVSVIDHGPGVPAEDRPRIFDRFYRGVRTAKAEGTGLGLAIVTDVVKAHRGEVFVSDGPGGAGTNITLIVPRGA
jgi:two-component system heavy metal sensor histidine kinase CusS